MVVPILLNEMSLEMRQIPLSGRLVVSILVLLNKISLEMRQTPWPASSGTYTPK
jgi:hypothetical protein